MKKRITTGKSFSVPGGLALGNGLSLCITVLMAILLAKLVSLEKMQWENIGYGIMLLLYISSLAGSALAASLIKHQRLVICLSAGLVYWVTLLSLTALFFGGQYSGMGVSALIILSGCGTVCLLSGIRAGDHRPAARRKSVRNSFVRR